METLQDGLPQFCPHFVVLSAFQADIVTTSATAINEGYTDSLINSGVEIFIHAQT